MTAEEEGLEKGMQKGMQEGIQKGIQQGETQFARLMDRLMREGNEDIMTRVIRDEAVRKQMYKKYKIE